MKKIKIGIPRALLYHRYGVLWKNFFEKIGCNVILSPETNNEILKLGINNSVDESCLSYKIFIGHTLYLVDKCDYILISRICDYGRKDKVCTRLNGNYDTIKELIPKNKILEYNIERTRLCYQFIGLMKTGLKITINIPRIIYAYLYAFKKQKKFDENKENNQKNLLLKENKKILIVSHFYNIEDKYISKYIIDYLKENNLIVLSSNKLNKKIAKRFSEYFSDTLYWKYSKEQIGSIYYYKNQIDGIIYISSYPCGIDSLVNNLSIMKNKDIPQLNIIIDEFITESNLETKLESFLEIIERRNNE
ncbi:MAG: hypothetical protein IJO57_03960 [Bacilli bacterium]|nr:hypothetical protein [Bacilli bacterium]